MSTAISLIKKALFLNGASSEINVASPELIQLTFEALVDMLTEWASLNIVTGITLPANQADDLLNPPDTNQVIQHELAILSAPLFQLTAPATVIAKSSQLYNELMTNYSIVPTSCFPETLPIGSGNQQNVNGARFYIPDQDCLTDVNGIPLLGGAGS